MSQSMNRTPCTIITGFLGSGKTTLLRHLLQNNSNKRLAVIVNEFGDIGIDGEILKSCGLENCPEDNIVELANGCICCTVADDFAPALNKLLSQKQKIDHILIETSGLALPKPLVQAFQWPDIRSKVTVDSVISVVDAAALSDGRIVHDLEALDRQKQQDDTLEHDDPIEEVFEDQLACADLIVLTKTDLLSEEQVQQTVAHIRSLLSRSAKIIPVKNGQVSSDVVLGLGLSVEDDIENRPSHHDHEEEHDHDDFESFYVDLPSFSEPEKILERIKAVTEDEKVLRVKGFINISEKPMRLLIQAVGTRLDHYYDRPWKEGERKSRLVVIGEHGIDQKAISEKLAS